MKTICCALCIKKYKPISDDIIDCKQGIDCDFSYDGFNITSKKYEFSGGYWSNYDCELYISNCNFGLKKHDHICNECVKIIDKKELIYYRDYM